METAKNTLNVIIASLLRGSLLLSLAIILFSSGELKATHVAAGEILYECVGPDEFLITLQVYRDCAGSPLPASQTITINNPCGGPTLLTLNQVLVEEISQLCDDDLTNSTCNGGTLPGIELHSYEATITLPPCNFITFAWTLCCRNGAIDNIFVDVNDTDFYIETTMYSQSFPCDDSPVFGSSPVPYLCQGLPATYGFGASDANGNIMEFEFVEALEDPNLSCVYLAGYSYQEPIQGISMDPSTGQMTFTPTQLGNFVVTVLVSTYDPDSVLIGTVLRDMQFVVIPCANQPPDPTTGVVSNLSLAEQTGPYDINSCQADAFCFDFVIIDPNAGQTLTLETNLQSVLPGATINYSGTDTIRGTICYTVAPDIEGLMNFQIIATDDACPVTAFSTYVYSVEICPPPTVVIPNVFSPNGDGLNDSFDYIDFGGFMVHQMDIYNRWGQLVHTSNTEREDMRIWKPDSGVSEGTYYYVFSGTTYEGEKIGKTGHITLLR